MHEQLTRDEEVNHAIARLTGEVCNLSGEGLKKWAEGASSEDISRLIAGLKRHTRETERVLGTVLRFAPTLPSGISETLRSREVELVALSSNSALGAEEARRMLDQARAKDRVSWEASFQRQWRRIGRRLVESGNLTRQELLAAVTREEEDGPAAVSIAVAIDLPELDRREALELVHLAEERQPWLVPQILRRNALQTEDLEHLLRSRPENTRNIVKNYVIKNESAREDPGLRRLILPLADPYELSRLANSNLPDFPDVLRALGERSPRLLVDVLEREDDDRLKHLPSALLLPALASPDDRVRSASVALLAKTKAEDATPPKLDTAGSRQRRCPGNPEGSEHPVR